MHLLLYNTYIQLYKYCSTEIEVDPLYNIDKGHPKSGAKVLYRTTPIKVPCSTFKLFTPLVFSLRLCNKTASRKAVNFSERKYNVLSVSRWVSVDVGEYIYFFLSVLYGNYLPFKLQNLYTFRYLTNCSGSKIYCNLWFALESLLKPLSRYTLLQLSRINVISSLTSSEHFHSQCAT